MERPTLVVPIPGSSVLDRQGGVGGGDVVLEMHFLSRMSAGPRGAGTASPAGARAGSRGLGKGDRGAGLSGPSKLNGSGNLAGRVKIQAAPDRLGAHEVKQVEARAWRRPRKDGSGDDGGKACSRTMVVP